MAVYDFREKYYEVINGKKILFESDSIAHNLIKGGLIMAFAEHVKRNRSGLIFMQLETHFPDGNIFYPDFLFIDKARAKIVIDNPHQPLRVVPDMVAEVFSRSTMKRDIGIKKDIYEQNGVKEYWMIDPWRETVEVHILRDGKFEFDELYQNWNADELARLTDSERAEVKFEVPVNVLDGFKIKIKNIFGWWLE